MFLFSGGRSALWKSNICSRNPHNPPVMVRVGSLSLWRGAHFQIARATVGHFVRVGWLSLWCGAHFEIARATVLALRACQISLSRCGAVLILRWLAQPSALWACEIALLVALCSFCWSRRSCAEILTRRSLIESLAQRSCTESSCRDLVQRSWQGGLL